MSAESDALKPFNLGMSSIDATHGEFVELVNRINAGSARGFAELYSRLLEHTRAHFAAENTLMEQSGFPATAEHRGEHNRVLGEMSRLAERLQGRGTRLVRAYVKEQLPSWFKLHLITMDSALASHLAKTGVMAGTH